MDKPDRQNQEAPAVSGYSFPYGVPLVFYPLFLYGAYRGLGHWWGWVFEAVFLILLAVFLVTALSRKSYEKIHAQYPDLNRLTWVLNYLLFFFLLPLLVWLLIFLRQLI